MNIRYVAGDGKASALHSNAIAGPGARRGNADLSTSPDRGQCGIKKRKKGAAQRDSSETGEMRGEHAMEGTRAHERGTDSGWYSGVHDALLMGPQGP